MAITFWGLIALSCYILFGISGIIAVIILFAILCVITWITKLISAANKPYISEELPLSMESLYALFQAFGSFVMLDGKFTENENNVFLNLLSRLKQPEETNNVLCDEFNKGRKSSKSFKYFITQFINSLPDNSITHKFVKNAVIAWFISFAYAEQRIIPAKKNMLKEIGVFLGDAGIWGRLFLFERTHGIPPLNSENEYKKNSANNYSNSSSNNHYKQTNQNNHKKTTTDNNLSKYYALLDVSCDATDAEVKKAWRKKAQEFHPDRIQGKGLPESFMKYATEQLQLINEAYDTICRARNIK